LRAHGKLEQIGGSEAIDELAGWVPAAGHAGEYGRIVRDNAQMRALLRATYEIQAQIAERGRGGEELIEEPERLIFGWRGQDVLARDNASRRDRHRTRAAPASQSGAPRGPRPHDRLSWARPATRGLQPGRLYVLAGRPATGKSLLAGQIARHVATHESARVLVASLEMGAAELAQRHLAAETSVPPDRLHLGDLRSSDWPALIQAASDSEQLPVHIVDDGGLTVANLRARARQIMVRDGVLGLILVDYLTLMKPETPSGNRVEDVSQISRGLKQLARELNVPLMAVSQLNRAVEARPDKRPLLSDLRDSGQVEADSDAVLMLYRDDYYDPDSERPGELDIIVRKNRQGRLGAITTEIDSRLRYRELNKTAPSLGADG